MRWEGRVSRNRDCRFQEVLAGVRELPEHIRACMSCLNRFNLPNYVQRVFKTDRCEVGERESSVALEGWGCKFSANLVR